MSASLVLATTDGEAGQKRIIFAPAPKSDTDSENDHHEYCHCSDCRRLGRFPRPCHCSDCHDHDVDDEQSDCKCHCPSCHECEKEQCGCHCDFCHKCDACTEDCQCFYCYEETGLCLECDEDCEFCQLGNHEYYCGCDYCTRQMTLDGTYHEDLVPGAITCDHKSVYNHRPYHCSAVKHSPRYFYDHYTAKELRGFVRARHLRDPYPEGLTLKYAYIRVLEAADRSPGDFRFLDLPPEVRTLIYEQLLDLDGLDLHDRPAKLHTQILRSCQLVRKEATDVLCSSAPVSCVVVADESYVAPGTMTYRAVRVRNHIKDAHDGSRLDYECLWPAFLGRVRHVRLVISLHDWTFEAGPEFDYDDDETLAFGAGLRFVRIALRRLAVLLADGRELRKLDVHPRLAPRPEACAEDKDIVHALTPLGRLRNLNAFTLNGDVPNDLSDDIATIVTMTD